jgi:arginase
MTARPELGLLGIPIESGAGQPGALMGPDALRTAGLTSVLEELGYAVVDHGNLAPPAPVASGLVGDAAERCRNAEKIAAWTRLIHDHAFALIQAHGVPIFLGGDHSLSMGTVSAVARHCRAAGRRLVVLWLDAHADFNTPATTPSGNMHGMSLAFACGEGSLVPLLGDRPFVPLPPGDVHLFGLRSIDAGERAALAAHGVHRTDMRMIDEFGVAALIRRFLATIGGTDTHLHVSLDVDFLDPAIAPGVGTTVPGGATFREAHLVMELLHECGLVGSLDLVELNPFLDERGRSATLLCELTGSLFGRTVLDRPTTPASGD